MYYDRRLPPGHLDLQRAPKGPLAWIVDFVKGRWGEKNLAHIQFRRAKGTRSRGGIQVYLGRTSPLEVLGRPRDEVQFVADKAYRAITPALFGRRFAVKELRALRRTLKEHLKQCALQANQSFTEGEAVAHAGMMRRYGLEHRRGDALLAVDSEVRVGYGSRAERAIFEDEIRVKFQPGKAGIPRKLDVIGMLADGNTGLVEIKEEGGDLQRAVVQVAAHVFVFRKLMAQSPFDFRQVLHGLAEQKVSVELIPGHNWNQAKAPLLVPIIAAPDQSDTWSRDWEVATRTTRRAHRSLLKELRFWRLSNSGEMLEEHVP